MTIPAIEIGGSHVSAALVHPSGELGPVARAPIDGADDVATLLAAITTVAARIDAPVARWGIAIPGPFDYEAGIGRYQGVGKFESLNGVDVGAALRAGFQPPPSGVHFVGDAIAFALGEWTSGPAQGRRRMAALTLGTGVGSAFLDDGHPVTTGPSVPPEGRADLLTAQGGPLEDLVSTRAILADYRRQGDPTTPSVADIARRADAGDELARHVFSTAYRALGETLAPYIRAFQAEALVIGGGISAAWHLIEPPLRAGLAAQDLPIVQARDTEASALRGAAISVLHGEGRRTRPAGQT
jgi:glucokinase